MSITVEDTGFNTMDATTEWAAAVHFDGTGWDLISEPTTDRAAALDAVQSTTDSVLISREVTSWQTVPELRPPRLLASDDTVNGIIAEEDNVIRGALNRGATIVVTKTHKPAERVLHRIGCPSLTPLLDRSKAWTTWFRERLVEDHTIRPSMPDFHTRDDAEARLAGIRQCTTCEPELHGATRSIRSLRAGGLAERHLGLTLATEGGTPLGTITDIRSHTSAAKQQRWGAEHVTITTDAGPHEVAGTDRVHILGNVSETNLTTREAALRQRLGVA